MLKINESHTVHTNEYLELAIKETQEMFQMLSLAKEKDLNAMEITASKIQDTIALMVQQNTEHSITIRQLNGENIALAGHVKELGLSKDKIIADLDDEIKALENLEAAQNAQIAVAAKKREADNTAAADALAKAVNAATQMAKQTGAARLTAEQQNTKTLLATEREKTSKEIAMTTVSLANRVKTETPSDAAGIQHLNQHLERWKSLKGAIICTKDTINYYTNNVVESGGRKEIRLAELRQALVELERAEAVNFPIPPVYF